MLGEGLMEIVQAEVQKGENGTFRIDHKGQVRPNSLKIHIIGLSEKGI